MIIIIGKTCSGKTAIVNRLVSKYGFNRLTTYTTRPMRKGEVNNRDYYFISNEEFLEKVRDGFFVEWKAYKTLYGVWYYGTSYADIRNAEENDILIITPEGYSEIKNSRIDKNMKVLYIYSNRSTIKNRLSKRGDNKEEANRRFETDTKDFKEAEKLADRIFYNNSGKNLDVVVDEILKYLEG